VRRGDSRNDFSARSIKAKRNRTGLTIIIQNDIFLNPTSSAQRSSCDGAVGYIVELVAKGSRVRGSELQRCHVANGSLSQKREPDKT